MPGVPSSRGCDACRLQKKKCDESKPACGRCTRLGIACNGAGQQRYKFHINTKPPLPRKRSPKSSSQSSGHGSLTVGGAAPSASTTTPTHEGQLQRLVTPSSEHTRFPLLSTPSGNAQMAITGRLVSALKVSDPRFDLSVYGSFLREIPRRVGCSPVLDAAVSAMTVTFPLAMAVPSSDLAFSSAAQPTVQMLQHYGHALTKLRACLSSRESIAAPETLCALYLIVVLQGWLQQEDGRFPGHGEAIAAILSAMKNHQTGWGEFEHGIVKTLSFLVVMESFVNPRIQLHKHLRRMTDPVPLPEAAPHPQTISCLDNNSLVNMSTYLRDPYVHYSNLVEAYGRVRADRARFAALIASIPIVPSADGLILQPSSQEYCYVHLRYQTGYATLTLLAIRIAVVLARIPCSYGSLASTTPMQLDDDLRIYINDLATVAEQAAQYYPLGSSFMPLCLLAAYSTQASIGGDSQQKQRIKHLYARYRPGIDVEREWHKIKEANDDSEAYGNSETQARKTSRHCGSVPNDTITNNDMCCIL